MEELQQEYDFYDRLDLDHYDNIFTSEIRLPKRYIRDSKNPFENWSIDEFQKRYRFTQESVFYIVSLIKPQLQKYNNRGLPIAPEIAVLLTLRFYATASFQIVCSDLLSLSQPTASNIITKVSELLARLVLRFIKFPRGSGESINRELFRELGKNGRWPGLPGIDGAIDCTHIKIVSTPGCYHHETFRNRKSYFSINVQAIVGPNMEFLDIVSRWAGSMHDSRIFQMSSVYMKYSQGILNGRLVGDNGYPTLPFVLTPIRPTPEDLPSIRYNRPHVKTRNVIERTFGVWKRRFPCLSKGLGNKLSTVCNVIVACAVLHNLSLILKDCITLEENNEVSDHNADNIDSKNTLPEFASGFAIRNNN